MKTKTQSQKRQSNGCKHVGGLCLIDESKKAGACVQTCKKCGWIRVHGERFFHPAAQVFVVTESAEELHAIMQRVGVSNPLPVRDEDIPADMRALIKSLQVKP